MREQRRERESKTMLSDIDAKQVRQRKKIPLMADLRSYRVQEAKTFCHTGIDYAGPLYIIPYRRRGVQKLKAYVCLFVCLVTKAVHIELASDLNSLKRFLSRRSPVAADIVRGWRHDGGERVVRSGRVTLLLRVFDGRHLPTTLAFC
ncbi:hypothetical protein EVAR_89947_1 [Eumeta japonica]|uniref:Uncharacterized protein n=1 Tax=Eumeta variegata TaxID=151549 RepID=A0A4C1XN32_EUMVA|nr:hypothetical protein EVAR_89947_1 [Eumeta japonica]